MVDVYRKLTEVEKQLAEELPLVDGEQVFIWLEKI
jgi:hypothetical protein